MQSTLHNKIHVAFIMDGNGRWAAQRRLPRIAGHKAGVDALRHIVDAAPRFGVGVLTAYALPTDNWRRPRAEVDSLMTLLRKYLRNDIARLVRNGTRLSVIGRLDRLTIPECPPPPLERAPPTPSIARPYENSPDQCSSSVDRKPYSRRPFATPWIAGHRRSAD